MHIIKFINLFRIKNLKLSFLMVFLFYTVSMFSIGLNGDSTPIFYSNKLKFINFSTVSMIFLTIGFVWFGFILDIMNSRFEFKNNLLNTCILLKSIVVFSFMISSLCQLTFFKVLTNYHHFIGIPFILLSMPYLMFEINILNKRKFKPKYFGQLAQPMKIK